MPCTKIGRYPSLKKARDTIRFMKGKGYNKLIPYYCTTCHVWHVSSEDTTKKYFNYKKSDKKKWKAKQSISRG